MLVRLVPAWFCLGGLHACAPASTSQEPTGAPESTGVEAVSAEAMTIVVTNLKSIPIYIQNQAECESEPARLSEEGGKRLRLSAQANSCAQVASGKCVTFGDCPGAGVFKLDPGQSMTTKWDGTVAETRTLDAAPKGCPNTCVDQRPPLLGKYKLSAHAWSRCEKDCACEPAVPDAPCQRPKGLQGEPDLVAELPVSIPGARRVELTFR